MVRSGLLGAAVLLLCPMVLPAQLPAEIEHPVEKTLKVQRAMELAQEHLDNGAAEQAVAVLEKHLSLINGNAAYLLLLRDAYRLYIKELHLSNRAELGNRYLERLSILDRNAVNDPSLRPEPRKTDQAKAPPEPAAKGADKYYQRVTEDTKTPLARLTNDAIDPNTVRGKQQADPFDDANRRAPAANPSAEKAQSARRLLARAEEEFRGRRFKQANALYTQAHEADPAITADCRDRWAYCMLNQVVEQLNSGALDSASLKKLSEEIRTAVAMAPDLANTGRWLTEELEQRQGAALPAGQAPQPQVQVQHSQQNGMQVAETQHFRVFHKQGREFAEKVAQVAERTRVEVLQKWFGGNGAQWRAKCDVYLHADGQAYTSATGVSAVSPGHSRIESSSGTVVSRRMDLRCDAANLLTGVLPHETTHVVLAGQFGRFDVPRWADEGIAVLSEPADAVAQHRRNLAQSLQNRQTFTIRELLHLNDYPQAQRVGAFYAQSVDLVAFLTELRGPRVFADFVRDGLESGYEPAMRRHYGLAGFDDLQSRWQQQAIAEVQAASDNAIASGRR